MNAKLLWKLLFTFLIFCSNCAQVSSFGRAKNRALCYRKMVFENETAHVVTVDTKRAQVMLVQAKDQNLTPVSSLAKEHGASVAINAGFFTKEGRPAGIFKINGRWISYPTKNRGVFGFNRGGDFYFDRLRPSTKDAKDILASFSKQPWWQTVENIVGGAPLLLMNKTILEVESEKTLSSFLESKYARTAICVDGEKQLKLIVIDGGDRRSLEYGKIGGMTIVELARFMAILGCTEGLNLDGGYSSTMIVDGTRVNAFSLSFLPERPVSDALVIRE